MPELDNKSLAFSTNSDVMFGFSCLEARFQVHDSRNYTLVAQVETSACVQAVLPSWDDLRLAVTEWDRETKDLVMVKLYDVGQENLEEKMAKRSRFECY